MKRLSQWIIILVALGYYAACAPTKFEDNPLTPNACQGLGATACLHENGKDYFSINKSSVGLVDILIVNDNSGSMSFEQRKMAERFNQFIAKLESRELDYRIGMISTNTGKSSIKKYGASSTLSIASDGALIKFKNPTTGYETMFIDSNTPDRDALFSATIQREETDNCEKAIKALGSSASDDYCPSGDERGILAANLTISNNPSSFIRPNAHLAVIFLADEDVRSTLYDYSTTWKLSTNDLPQTLIGNIKSKYAGKGFSIHSIIVKPGTVKNGLSPDEAAAKIATVIPKANPIPENSPYRLFNTGDETCLNQQYDQLGTASDNPVKGTYGFLYALATRMAGGVEGNICDPDYTSQLQSIGSALGSDDIPLNCANPSELSLEVTQSNGSPIPGLEYTIENSKIIFNQVLPEGSKISGRYACDTLN